MHLHPGTIGARCVMARAKWFSDLKHGRDGYRDPAQLYENCFGRDRGFEYLQKTAVPGGGTSGSMSGMVAHSDEIAAVVNEGAEQSIVGRMQGTVPIATATTPYMAATQRATAGWFGEGKGVRVSPLTIDRSTLGRAKVGVAVILTDELVSDTSPGGVETVRRMLVGALQRAIDSAFADASNAGVAGERPASVCYGAATVQSLGDFGLDLHQLIDRYTGDLASAYLLADTADLGRITIDLGGQGLASGLGVRGGEVAGIAALGSEGCPRNQLALIDSSSIAIHDGGYDIGFDVEGMVELDDAPAGAALVPTAASSSLISLFQSDLIAVKLTRRIMWKAVGAAAGRVVVCSTDYLGS